MQLAYTWHTFWLWLTGLQMVFSLIVCYVPFIQMLLQRNTLRFGQQQGIYQICLSKIVLTVFIVLLLFIMDIVFMVVGLVFGTIIQILNLITCEYVSTELYDRF